MKRNKVLSILFFSVVAAVAVVGFAKQVKVLRIYSGGEMIQEHKISDIDYVEIQDKDDEEGIINGHEYVDLGLPSGLKWATCNVGASSPEEYGDYFAWGETEPKEYYDTENCKTYKKNIQDISGNPEYDAARANWGGTWRMPSQTEIQELIDKCTLTLTTKNGIQGCLVIGPNNKQIFLPAAGSSFHSRVDFPNSLGSYWCSSPGDSQSAYEYYFTFNSNDTSLDVHKIDRYLGQSIRAVSGLGLSIEGALKSLTVKDGNENAITLSWKCVDGARYKVYRSSDNETFTEIANSLTTTTYTDETPNEGANYYKIKIILDGEESEYSNTVTGTILQSQFDGAINGHEYIDLGLPSGLKWATCNVGASSPAEYGDYLAWGETQPKENYDTENYKNYRKDMPDISGNPEYDAARAQWGETWRMPSKIEIQELIDKCIWEYVNINGKNGYRVTGPNKKQIFIPAAGYRNGSSLYEAELEGLLWSSTPYAFSLYICDSHYMIGSNRYYGQSVRAVSGVGLSVENALKSLVVSEDNDNTLTLDWQNIDGATYNVYRSTDNITFTLIVNSLTTPTYTDESPIEGVNYYKIKIILDSEESEYSNTVSDVILPRGEENLMALALKGNPQGGPQGPYGYDSQLVENGWQYWNCDFSYDSIGKCYTWEDRYWEINGADLGNDELIAAKEAYKPYNDTKNWPSNIRIESFPNNAVDEDGEPYGENVALFRWDGSSSTKKWIVYPLKNLPKGVYAFTCKVGCLHNRNDKNSQDYCYVRTNGMRVTMQNKVGPGYLTYEIEPNEEDSWKQAGVPVPYQSSFIQIEDGGEERPIMHKWCAIIGNPSDGDTYLCLQGSWAIFVMGEISLVRIGDYPE